MDLVNILIVFSGGLILGSGLLVFVRNKKDLSARFFLAMAFSIALWTISLAFNRIENPDSIQLFMGRMAYILGYLMVYFFWLFSLHYPVPQEKKNILLSLLGPVYSLFLFYIVIFTDLFIKETIIIDGVFISDKYVDYQYYIFMCFIVFYSAMALKNLIKKTYESEGIHSHNLKLITSCLFISAVIILVSDLIMPLFGNFSLNWIGPVSLLPIVIGVARILSLR